MNNRLVFTGKTLNNNELYGVEYQLHINSEIDLQVGDTASAELTFSSTYKPTVGTEFTYYNAPAGSSNFSQVGIFIVKEVVKNKNLYKCTCYDRMVKFDVSANSVWDNLGNTFTLSQLISALGTLCGVTVSSNPYINSGYSMSKDIVKTLNISARQLLSYATQVAGAYARINVSGELELFSFEDTSYSLTNTQYYNFEISEYPTHVINRVWAGIDDSDVGTYYPITPPAVINDLRITNNPLLNVTTTHTIGTQVQNIYNQVSAYPAYYPFKCNVFDLGPLRVGMFITVNGFKGAIFSISWSNSGYVLECTGNEYREKVDISSDPEIVRLKGSYNSLKRTVDETVIEVGSLSTRLDDDEEQIETNTANITVNAGAISSEVTRATAREGELSSAITQTATDLTVLINGKSKTYRTNTVPTSGIYAGDLWYCTKSTDSTHYGKWYRYNGSTWDSCADPQISTNTSNITANANAISAEVIARGNADTALQSNIDIQAGRITSEVSRAEGVESTLSSRITQTESDITSKVSKGSVISTINQSAESVTIAANKVDLSGHVTFSNLSTAGQTSINGSNITTGTIDASVITVNNLNANNINTGYINGARISDSNNRQGTIYVNTLDSNNSVKIYTYVSEAPAGNDIITLTGSGIDFVPHGQSQHYPKTWLQLINGSGTPAAYLKTATVSGNTLTLTKQDDSTVTFTPVAKFG